MVYLGRHVHSLSTWILHISTEELVNLSAGTPEINITACCCTLAKTCHETLFYLAPRHVDWTQYGRIGVCAMTSRIEFLDIGVTSNLIVFHFVTGGFTRPYHLCKITTVDNATIISGIIFTGIKVIGTKLKLIHFQ